MNKFMILSMLALVVNNGFSHGTEFELVSKGVPNLEEQCKNESNVLQVLIGKHNAAFGKDDLIEKPPNDKEIAEWLNAIACAKIFLIENSKGLLGKMDSTIEGAFLVIEKANRDLTVALTRSSKLLKRRHAFKTQIAIFGKIVGRFKYLRPTLATTIFRVRKEKKNSAKAMLEKLMLFIEITANAARDQANKYL